MKYLLISVITMILFIDNANAQNPYKSDSLYTSYWVAAQLTQAFDNTPYTELSLSAGWGGPNCQFGVGPTVRYILPSVGHRKMNLGFNYFIQYVRLYPVLLSIKLDVLWGQSYKRNDYDEHGRFTKEWTMKVVNRELIFPTVATAYAITPKTSIAIGYSPYLYDPVERLKRYRIPHPYSGRIVFSARYSFEYKARSYR